MLLTTFFADFNVHVAVPAPELLRRRRRRRLRLRLPPSYVLRQRVGLIRPTARISRFYFLLLYFNINIEVGRVSFRVTTIENFVSVSVEQ